LAFGTQNTMGKCISRNWFEGLVLDFDAQPQNEDDQKLYDEATAFLLDAENIISRIEGYESSSALSRKALAEPTAENRWHALESVCKNTLEIYHFWRFAKNCSQFIGKFLESFVAQIGDDQLTDPSDQLQLSTRAALVRQFASLISAVIRFDRAKAMANSIQNDLSFYRRIIQSAHQPQTGVGSANDRMYEEKLFEWKQPAELTDSVVSTVSFFLASPVPVMQEVCKAIEKISDKSETIQALIPFIPNLYVHLIKKKTFPADSEFNFLCLRAMVGFIIVTDRVEPEGAFHSNSVVKINDAISILENFHKNHPTLNKEEQVYQLVDCLKYWSVHLQDDTTPSKIAWRLMM